MHRSLVDFHFICVCLRLCVFVCECARRERELYSNIRRLQAANKLDKYTRERRALRLEKFNREL